MGGLIAPLGPRPFTGVRGGFVADGSWKATVRFIACIGTMNQASEIVARASRPCESCDRHTGETPVPLPDGSCMESDLLFNTTTCPVAGAVQSHLRDGGIPSVSDFRFFMHNQLAWNIPIFTKLGLFAAMARRLHIG